MRCTLSGEPPPESASTMTGRPGAAAAIWAVRAAISGGVSTPMSGAPRSAAETAAPETKPALWPAWVRQSAERAS